MDKVIYHHGIIGMKWGVRRYQNPDGSLTSAGRKRYGADSDSYSEHNYTNKERKSVNARRAIKTIAGTAAVGAAVYMLGTKNGREMLRKAGSSAKGYLTSDFTKETMKKLGDKTLESFGKGLSRAGSAMTEAALTSIGSVAIAKLTRDLSVSDTDPQSIKDRNKILLDTATAGISAATGANKGKDSKPSGGSTASYSSAVGSPSKKGVDKQSAQWQNLFKDSSGNQRSADDKNVIRSMAGAGYDVDQISDYLRKKDSGQLSHSFNGNFVYGYARGVCICHRC